MKKTLGIFAAITFFSCGKDAPIPPDAGRDYAVFVSNEERIFKADSILFDDFTGTSDTISFFQKEVTGQKFKDLEDRDSYHIDVYTTEDTTQWNFFRRWYVTPTGTRIEWVEDDKRYIRLVFPLREGQVWNGNAMNALPPETLQVKNLHQPSSVEGNIYDSTVAVLALDTGNLILSRKREYIFAKGTGLVSQDEAELKTDVDGTILSGYEFRKMLLYRR